MKVHVMVYAGNESRNKKDDRDNESDEKGLDSDDESDNVPASDDNTDGEDRVVSDLSSPVRKSVAIGKRDRF